MSIMLPDRERAEEIARTLTWFWLPCPVCERPFGGHEVGRYGGHEESIPVDWRHDEAGVVEIFRQKTICPDCTFKGLGCKAHLEIGYSTHEDCDYMRAHLRKLRGSRG